MFYYYNLIKIILNEGKRGTPTWLMSVDITGADGSWWELMSTSTADESHSDGWKLK